MGIPRSGGGGKRLLSKAHACTSEDEKLYNADELEFLVAIDRYKRHRRRPYPDWAEVLGVLKKLGWRKAKPEQVKADAGVVTGPVV